MNLKEFFEELKILFFYPNNVFHRLKMKYYGINYGKRFIVKGKLNLKINGKGCHISIGDNFICHGDLDLRNRENGKIIIGNNVLFDSQIRLVAANDATISIGDGTAIGFLFVCNAGADAKIGPNCMFSNFVFVSCSVHQYKKGINICDQPYAHAPITIGRDVFIGAHSFIAFGSVINDGAVIGANSVVNKEIPVEAIAVGVPARIVGYRE